MGQAMLFLSTPQAAERLGISPRTLEGYRITGEGPVYYRFGCVVRYLSADVDDWAAARRRISTTDEGQGIRAATRGHRRKPARRATGKRDKHHNPLCANPRIRAKPDLLKGRVSNR